MKMRVLRDKKGKVVASTTETPEEASCPRLDVESEDGGATEETEVEPRDLLDIDKLFERLHKK
jgi:hypothetical protein